MAYDMVEMPEPYRSDWRTAFLISVVVTMFGRRSVSPFEIHEKMKVYFSCFRDSDEKAKKTESAIKGWLSRNRTKREEK